MALRSFREGDKVKVVILSVDLEKRRVSLGLKPSYFGEGDFEAPEEDDEAEAEEPEALGVVEEDAESEAEEGNGSDVHDGANDSADDDDDDAMVVDEVAGQNIFSSGILARGTGPTLASQALKLEGGFKWSGDQDSESEDVSESSSDEDDEEEQATKKKRRRRKEIEQDLTADLHTKVPESNADFERMLLGSPNSSYLWVQYMAFQLQLSEVEKAREIARRALKTINFREEQEKLNVWIALLNLENVYGTEDSLDATFKDAARHNDSKTIHLRLAAIFDQSEKLEVRHICT